MLHAAKDVIPLYFRIFLILERRLRAGDWRPGVALPSEQQFAAEFGVSRVTIRNAMAMLEEAELIRRFRGRGTFINEDALPGLGSSGLGGFKKNIRQLELETEIELHEFTEIVTPADLPSTVGYELADKLLLIRRTRRRDGQPFSHSVSYVQPPASHLLRADEMGNRTVVAVLEDKGLVFSRADQRLSAIAADADVAAHLQVPVASPLICMKRALFDVDENLVQYIEIFYDPAQFEYRVTLNRETFGATPQWVPVH